MLYVLGEIMSESEISSKPRPFIKFNTAECYFYCNPPGALRGEWDFIEPIGCFLAELHVLNVGKPVLGTKQLHMNLFLGRDQQLHPHVFVMTLMLTNQMSTYTTYSLRYLPSLRSSAP